MTKFIDTHLEKFLGEISSGYVRNSDAQTNICVFDGTPAPDCTTYTTLGLSDHVLALPEDRSVRLELVLPIESKQKHDSFPGLLQYVAEKVLKSHRALLRGDVICLNHAIVPKSTCTELYVSNPVVFPDGFAANYETAPATIFVWLIPITQSEMNFVTKNGWNKFEDLLVEKDPNLFDLYRPSVVDDEP